MQIKYLYNTLRHLKIKQVLYQVKYRLFKPKSKLFNIEVKEPQLKLVGSIAKNKCLDGDVFDFLNISSKFTSWNDASNGMLWAYNLNYMDYLNQKNMSFEEGAKWIDKFIADLPTNKVGLDPYPIALRGINWIKFISKYGADIPNDKLEQWNNSLYSQYKLLEKKLEYHLLGNHLLEDAYSLFIASIYFSDEKMYLKSSKLLRNELNEQILADGAHYEQSPMYHCILLDRLLDCCNVSFNNIRFESQVNINAFLREKTSQMLGHLSSIIYKDQTIPLLNDSANGIAPIPSDLFDYANRLSIEWEKIPMGDCGYRKMSSKRLECILDIGDIKASYQPGHSHADTFNYELRIDDAPFIVDTGISTYNKNERRQYERSTMAHNTVSVAGKDSSEVWGGFRVARRAKVKILKEKDSYISAVHDGYGKKCLHYRIFELNEEYFEVVDRLSTKVSAVNLIHFAPNVVIESVKNDVIVTNIAEIHICGVNSVEIEDEMMSTEYNKFDNIKVLKMYFSKEMKYNIVMR